MFEFVTFALFSEQRVFQSFEIFSMLTAVFHSLGGEKFSAYAEDYDSWCVSEFSLFMEQLRCEVLFPKFI